MATLVSTMTFDVSTNANHRNWAQPLGQAFNTFGWLPTTDAGSISSTGNYGTATITNIAITSNVLTVTVSGLTNQFASSMVLQLSGLTTATFLNGVYVTIQNTGTPANDHTNTQFLASYTHANYSSASDTGTATILYNWQTSTGTPDRTDSAFPLNNIIRFRGAYVSLTPSFTNLQTTTNLTTISFGSNGHGLDLTWAVGEGFTVGTAVSGGTNITNASFTWLNTNPTGGWPISSLTSTTIVINTASSPRADIASTAVSVGTGAPNYVSTNGPTSPSTADAVLFGGDLYLCTDSTSFTNVMPGSSTTNWKRIFFDIWKSNDALSSTNRLYVKLLYGGASAGPVNPALYLSCGTNSDGQGNISQNYNWGNTTPSSVNGFGSTSASGTAAWESDFSGNSGRFSALLWRGYSFTTTICAIINIERSNNNSGTNTASYWNVLWAGGVASLGNGTTASFNIFEPSQGGAGPMELTTGASAGGAIHTINTFQAQSFNNSIPVLPVFPLVGYVANPNIGCISMKQGDTGEGAVVSTTFYGITYPYFMTTRGGAVAFGASTDNAAGILWE